MNIHLVRPKITVHAALRYLSRIEGADLGAIRRLLGGNPRPQAVLAEYCRVTGRSRQQIEAAMWPATAFWIAGTARQRVHAGRAILIVENGAVVTVIPRRLRPVRKCGKAEGRRLSGRAERRMRG